MPEEKFVKDVGKYESVFKKQCVTKGKKLYVTYEYDYPINVFTVEFDKLSNNFIEKNKFNTIEDGGDSLFVRFLAGCVSSFGLLPSYIWYNLKKFIKNLSRFRYITLIMFDELFLRFVIYNWAKKTNNVGFFLGNYLVNNDYITLLLEKNKELLNTYARENGIKDELINELIKRQSTVLPYGGNIRLRLFTALLFIPSIGINDESFASPLEDGAKNFRNQFGRAFPKYKYGRRSKSRKSKRSKSRKTKKNYKKL
jgi:hypothetical protein